MRFEKKTREQQISTMLSVHRHLNFLAFNGDLKEPAFEVLDMANSGDESVSFFIVDKNGRESIIFTKRLIDEISTWKTSNEQAWEIVYQMLHEMVHQYCYENSIDDGNHNEAWQTIAAQHGLISVWNNGEPVTEKINPLLQAAINIRIVY